MASKTKASGKMGVGMRIILFIAGIALILLCLKGVALTFFGATVSGPFCPNCGAKLGE